MIPLKTALATVDKEIGDRRVPIETVRVREATNRFLAGDQRSRLDLPSFDKSAVDGYAILEGDVRDEYRLAGIVVAGERGIDEIVPGTTVKVMTGAPVPAGTGKVVMVEQATEQDGLVHIDNPGPRRNICRKAEDVSVGQTVLGAGTRLGALHIANLIACGIGDVDVSRQVRLAIISTGDEIVDSAADLTPGKIMNVNGPLLGGLAHSWGLAVTQEVSVSDDKAELRRTLEQALFEADLVVLSGGVSAGDYDFVPEVVTDCGLQIHFSRVAVKPGLPTTFATGRERCIFGLPGNPVAVYLTFHLFVLRAVARLSGGTYEPRGFTVRLAGDLTRRNTSRTEYCPCCVSSDGLAERVTYHGSAHLTALTQADGFLVIPQGVESLPAGAEVTFVVFEGEV